MSIKVLLVDDEKLERVLIRNGFDWSANGFEIIGEASSAAEALEFVRHRRPELVLTDISMPHMDGLELSERILEFAPGCHIVIVTGYREFEYARRAVKTGVEDFLLKPVSMQDIAVITARIKDKIEKENRQLLEMEQLKKSVLADKDIVMESFFQRLVESRVGEEEAVHKLMTYSCEGMLKECICVNIQLRQEREETGHGRNLEKVLALIGDRQYDCCVCFVHYMKNIVLYYWNRLPEETEDIAGDLQRSISTDLGIHNTVGISGVNAGFGGVSQAFRQSGKALSAAALLGRNRVICYREYQEILRQNPDRKEIDWDDFTFCVNNALVDRVYEYVDEYVGRIGVSEAADLEYLRLISMNMLSKAGGTLNKYGLGLTQLLGEDALYDGIRQIHTVDEAAAYIKQVLDRIMNCHESKKIKQGNKVVEAALEYMDKNMFDPELSLKTVAANIYSNESYLSRVFKKDMQLSLIEYISRKRIEESIRLLNTTDLKVYEIAERIGYRDAHYFSICFKKQTGVTIKEFKKDKFNEK